MRDAIAEYRRLLTAEESIQSLDSALALLERLVRGRSWAHSGAARAANGTAMLKRLARVEWALRTLPEAIQASAEDIPDRQYSLISDVLMLIFHQSLFALLPRATPYRDRLLRTFKSFAESIQRPADRFQVAGLTEIEAGNLPRAIESFRAALAATHADDHEFMSRLQLYWTTLMEKKKRSEAFDLLLESYPRVSRKDLDEIAAMLKQTFRMRSGLQPAAS